MRIGGLGISEAAKWGETPEIQRSAQKTAEKAMTDGFVSQIQEMAKKGIYMSDDFVQYQLSYMKRTVSPDRSRPIAQAMAFMQRAANQYGTLLMKLLGGYSMKAYLGANSRYNTAEVYAPNGEMIAAQTCTGQWIDIQTEAESKFLDECTMVYLEAYRSARAEIKAAAQAPAQPAVGSVELRA